MGTRSLTTFEQDGHEIAVLYRQHDGYPEGHGEELREFLSGITLVRGLPGVENGRVANGMDCLAAQTVAHFKTGPGGFYLMAAGTRDVDEEYIYIVYTRDGEIWVRCDPVWDKKVIYNCPVSEMPNYSKESDPDDSPERSLSQIAAEIYADWKNPYFGAVPYLKAMATLNSVKDNYIADSGTTIVNYFLANAQTWRGETARRIKAELKELVK